MPARKSLFGPHEKAWHKSKTFWFNALTLAASILSLVAGQDWIKSNPHAVGGIGAAFALVNLGLRFVTSQQLTLALLVALSLISSSALAQIQLCKADKLSELRASLPKIADPEWHAVVHDPAAIIYTDAEMPRAYQHAGGAHSPNYNISADPTDSGLRHGEGGNANVQYPWQFPGGTDHAGSSARSFKQLLLPTSSNGVRWPVVTWRQQVNTPLGPEPLTQWIFPVGTTFGEVIQTQIGGRWLTCEVRLRLRTSRSWDVAILRPFPTCEDLAVALEQLDREQYAGQINSLRRSINLTSVDMSDRANPRPAIVAKSVGVSWLPVLDAEASAKLLAETPFKVATGGSWKVGANGVTCYAPTTDQPGQLVPVHYAGSLVGTDSDSCAKCHDGVQKHARHFHASRGWYGHVRGSDQIFSFHPFEPKSVSYNGSSFAPSLRSSFVSAGIVAQYDPARHPSSVYSQLEK